MKPAGNVKMTAFLAAALLSGCAGIPPEQRTEHDPWEALNRPIYSINSTIDRYTLKPLAKGYKAIAPSPVRTGVSNFLRT